MPRGFPDLEAYNYDAYHTTSRVSPLVLERAEIVSKWIESGSSVLDVGCGEGVVAEIIARNCDAKVTGIETSDLVLEKFRSRGFQGKKMDIDVGLKLGQDESFDYILFLEVIEHLRFPQRVLMDAFAHAKKAVIVTIPNSGYISWRIQMMRGYAPRQSFTHLHLWSINDFRIFCESLAIHPHAFGTLRATRRSERWLAKRLPNLFAYQQCWLLKRGKTQMRPDLLDAETSERPESSEHPIEWKFQMGIPNKVAL